MVLYQGEPVQFGQSPKVAVNTINIIHIIIIIIRIVIIIMSAIESIAAAICLFFSTPVGPRRRRDNIQAGQPAKGDQYPLFGGGASRLRFDASDDDDTDDNNYDDADDDANVVQR